MQLYPRTSHGRLFVCALLKWMRRFVRFSYAALNNVNQTRPQFLHCAVFLSFSAHSSTLQLALLPHSPPFLLYQRSLRLPHSLTLACTTTAATITCLPLHPTHRPHALQLLPLLPSLPPLALTFRNLGWSRFPRPFDFFDTLPWLCRLAMRLIILAHAWARFLAHPAAHRDNCPTLTAIRAAP